MNPIIPVLALLFALIPVGSVPWTPNVRVATTASIAHTGTPTIDGVVLLSDQFVLDWKNSDPTLNGLWVTHPGPWTRRADADEAGEFSPDRKVVVTEGTLYAGHTFSLVTSTPVVMGATPLVFTDTGVAPPLPGTVASSLKTTTGFVGVAAATAPTIGQVLTATTTNTATWQTQSTRLGTATVDLSIATKQVLYVVPTGKHAIVTDVIARNADHAGAPATAVGFGFNAAADDWISADVGYDSLTAKKLALNLTYGGLSSAMQVFTVGTAGQSFGAMATVPEGSALSITYDVLGFEY